LLCSTAEHARECGLTTRSTGRATAGHLGPVGGTQYIFANRAKASCLRAPVNSNVRPHYRSTVADIRLFPLEGAERHHADVDRWLATQPGELQTIARHWFSEMRGAGPDVLDLLHDSHPTACVGDLAFAYVNVFSEHVKVGFFLGTSLKDPSKLLQGTGRFMRHVKVRPNQALDETALKQLIRGAYEDMKARQSGSEQGAPFAGSRGAA
jgi:hypothetical protein